MQELGNMRFFRRARGHGGADDPPSPMLILLSRKQSKISLGKRVPLGGSYGQPRLFEPICRSVLSDINDSYTRTSSLNNSHAYAEMNRDGGAMRGPSCLQVLNA